MSEELQHIFGQTADEIIRMFDRMGTEIFQLRTKLLEADDSHNRIVAENKALSEKLADSEKEANKWIESALTWERTYRAQVEEFKALEKELATAKQSLAERDARIKEITNKIHFLFDAIKVQAENGGISTLSYWIGEELLKMIAHEALGPSLPDKKGIK